MRYLLTLLGMLVVLLAASCQLPSEPQTAGSVVATATLSDAEVVATPTEPLGEPQSTPLATPSLVTLSIWGPAALSAEQSPGFAGAVAAFGDSEPGVNVIYESKAISGTASLLNYLETASGVAPSILPDLIIFPAERLNEAVGTGLLVPLDPLLDEELMEDFYPFVQQGRFDEEQLVLPFLLTIEHGVTRADSEAAPPSRLSDLLSEEEDAPVWLLRGQAAAEGTAVPALLVQLASLNEKNGLLVAPNNVKLTEMLTRLQQAGQRGTLPARAFTIGESAPLYDSLATGDATLIEGDSRGYLQQLATGADIRHAAIPTLDGLTTSIVDGYLIALTTEEPRRQAAALALLEQLLEPTSFSTWTVEEHWLPARRSALARAALDPEYSEFLDDLLEGAQLVPSGPEWHNFSQLYQEQVQLLFSDEALSPGEVARRLLESFPTSSQ